MGNKVKYNLKNVHAAQPTRGEDGSFTYAKPKAIPGAVSISLDAEGDSSPFYADGIVYFRSTANNGYSGDLEIALIPEWFRTEILKEELDNNGVLIENATITELEKFALLFEFDGDVDLGIASSDVVAQVAWMNREQINELFDANMFVDTLEYFFTEVDKQ